MNGEMAHFYEAPITISSTTTIKAKAFKDGWLPSATQTGTYTINIDTTFLINESFESYYLGSFPTAGGWYLRPGFEGIGPLYQAISGQVHWSGSQSLQVIGDYSQRAEILHPINVSASDVIVYEAYFHGCTGGGHCQLFNPDEGIEGTNIHEVLFHNNTITVDGVNYSSYNNNEWYHIRVKYNQQNHTISMWLNTELIIDNQSFTPKPFPITHFAISSQYGYQSFSNWDDIVLWVEGNKSVSKKVNARK